MCFAEIVPIRGTIIVAADKDKDKDVELAPAKSGISMKVIIIIAIVVIVIVAGSIGATVVLLSGGSEKSSSSSSSDSEHDSQEVSGDASKPSIYYLLKPDFVINFENEGKANFLSVQLQLMARKNGPINTIESHMPVLRNDVLLLLSGQKYNVVRTTDGKKQLQKDILIILKKIIDEENKSRKKKDGDGYTKVGYIEEIYFTGFIMQ